jgi:integrase
MRRLSCVSARVRYESVQLGVADKDIQAILRHANVNTTLTYYVKSAPETSQAVMQKLEKAFKLGVKRGVGRTSSKRTIPA